MAILFSVIHSLDINFLVKIDYGEVELYAFFEGVNTYICIDQLFLILERIKFFFLFNLKEFS